MLQVHPSSNSSAANSALSADRRLELLHQELFDQNRRAATPFSHPLSRLGPLFRLREHIQDLSRLADAAILNAESTPVHHSDLYADLRALLKTQESWTDRLENQIWRLESQAKWHKQLRALAMGSEPSENAVDDFCSRLAGETCSLPTGLLLLPEPGLSFAPARRIDGWSKPLIWALEAVRLALFAAEVVRSQESVGLVPTQLAACMWIVASDLQHSDRFAQEPVETGSCQSELTELFGKQLRIPGPGERSRLIRFCSQIIRIMQTIEDASQTAIGHLIPPELADHYSRACRSKFLPSTTSPELARAERTSDRSELAAIMERLGLSVDSSGILPDPRHADRLERTSPESLQSGDDRDEFVFRVHHSENEAQSEEEQIWNQTRTTGQRGGTSLDYRPRLFVGDLQNEDATRTKRTAKAADVIREY